MKSSESLARRIVKAYLLFALAFSLFVAVVVALVVEGLEVRMVDDRLEAVAAWATPRLAAALPVEMPTRLSFYQGEQVPLAMRGLSPGIHELKVDGAGVHVFAGHNAQGPFVAVDRESDYESVELGIYSVLLLCLVAFVAMSVMLGRYMARRFLTPISDLSGAVARGSADLPLLDSSDELGILARAFADHTAELRAYLERERAFAGDVSHELRTPLTIIAGAAELLMLDHADKPHAYAASERIFRAAGEATESVNTLLLLARSPELIEADHFTLGPMLEDEVERHQPLVTSRPVTLAFRGGTDFAISASQRLVSAAVSNLIRNACLYTDEGSVTVTMQERTVVVCDTGRGLPPAVLAMLASDGSGAPLRGSEGTGFGLALVKRICAKLQATLSVHPRPGGGTEFAIHFPPLAPQVAP